MRAGTDAPTRRSVVAARVRAIRDGTVLERPDRVAAEEPMEVRVAGPGQEPVSVAVTMRTPGNDFELAVGFLFTEGVLASGEDVASVAYCDLPPEEQHYNVVTVRLRRPFDPVPLTRHFYASSSCGVCGKASLDRVRVRCAAVAPGPTVPASVVTALPRTLREAQRLFEQTGGLHAAGLFDLRGKLLALREDVGRHNAVDKLVGSALLRGELPLAERILMVSGRVGFEIVQKAAVAGVPIVCAVSAPSSLALEAARELGMTVVGFVRGSGLNVYTHPERVDPSA
ncbi:MAG TPA: formate dehydrogenase accessory sulfurtransferase FdhD [Actinomycetota bacterium]|nr:formate dehydrogenase accessory sulfurtransferase FdhD [Actinomycetota bacterium]